MSSTLGVTPGIAVAPTPRGYAIAKRTLDLGASAVGLVVASPIFIGVALGIKLTSPGPILFRQVRVGLGGRHFYCYKFRSMNADADEDEHRRHVRKLVGGAGGAGGRPDSGEAATWTPIAQDARVTRIGRLLRRSHLDELPQLLNVVRGEMSLVGPRPPIPYEVRLYQPWHLRRLAVKPGLTGLWQAVGWGKLSFDEGVRLDLVYIRRRSFWFDLALIVRTLAQIVTGRQF
jgi:lipopolysaccharide/colanic/teichoic acid biosynthesis glycosyltransferase